MMQKVHFRLTSVAQQCCCLSSLISPFQFDQVYMIGGLTRQDGKPGLPGRVTLSAEVKFCHVNVSMWSNPPSRGRIRDTPNSRKIHFSGGFSSLKVSIESHITEGCSKSTECRRELIAKTRGLPAFFFFTCLVTIQ